MSTSDVIAFVAVVVSALSLVVSVITLILQRVDRSREGTFVKVRVKELEGGRREASLYNRTGVPVKVESIDVALTGTTDVGRWFSKTPNDLGFERLDVALQGPPLPVTIDRLDHEEFTWSWPEDVVAREPVWWRRWFFPKPENFSLILVTSAGRVLRSPTFKVRGPYSPDLRAVYFGPEEGVRRR